MSASEVISVIGAGAWGTALGCVQAKKRDQTVVLWAREPEVAQSVNGQHENVRFLPGVKLPSNLKATNRLEEATSADLILIVVPAQFLRSVVGQLAGVIAPGTPLVLCAKGIEASTLSLMSQIASEELSKSHPFAVLSGPSFASEVAKGLPTALTLACAEEERGRAITHSLGTPYFRLYYTDDVVGTQMGGAVKNVLAIACGIVYGRELGENARASIIARGYAELERVAVACGGRAPTVAGLCGLGDLILTCTSHQSRNTSLGARLGRGETLDEILGSRSSVAEGVKTAEAIVRLADRHGIELPICEAVQAILSNGKAIEEAITGLLSRPFTDERTKTA